MSDQTLYHKEDAREHLLLTRIAEGDERAFTELFYTWHQSLGDYVLAITKSKPLTEEIVQDTFLKIWQRREQLTDIRDFRSWLFRVAKNYTFNCLRDLAREEMRAEGWRSELSVTTGGEVPDRESYYRLIEQAVDSLPAQQQRAYRLSREQGLTHEAIAHEMQLSRETVKRHISLALQAITGYVRRHGEQAVGLLWIMINHYKK